MTSSNRYRPGDRLPPRRPNRREFIKLSTLATVATAAAPTLAGPLLHTAPGPAPEPGRNRSVAATDCRAVS